MASILRKALRNQFRSRILKNLNKSEPAILSSTPQILAHPPCSRHNQIPFFLQKETVDSKLNLYPSFSFGLFLNPNGFFLNPISPNELVKSENDENEDSVKIWADSVKKKRKRKMNKHKLKKLRKCLRRKT